MMTEGELIDALRHVRLANAARAEDRAVETALGQMPRRDSRRKLFVGVLAAAALAVSPAGQSLAEEAGQLVGIGDPPTDPFPGSGDKLDSARVIGAGETPSGIAFELVERVSRESGVGPRGLTSAYLSFPSSSIKPRALTVLNAGVMQELSGPPHLRPFATLAPSQVPDSENLLVTAVTADPITSVEIKYPGQTSSQSVNVVGGDLGGGDSSDSPQAASWPPGLSFSAAFIPSTILGIPDPEGGFAATDAEAVQESQTVQRALQDVLVRGLDSEGNVVAELALSDVPNLATSLAMSR